jgi:hypothetical protein
LASETIFIIVGDPGLRQDDGDHQPTIRLLSTSGNSPSELDISFAFLCVPAALRENIFPWSGSDARFCSMNMIEYG